MAVRFELIHVCKQTGARAGILHTPHGDVQTPVFMPVGTQGTVKALPPDMVWGLGVRLVLANAYHLQMRPGSELIREAGGLHEFMRWPGALLTDSGGFQVFSLKGMRKITDEGVAFQSHIDGSSHLFTPESVMEIQKNLGADFAMSFDECADAAATHEYAAAAMRRTHAWAARGRAAMSGSDQALFGIAQGGLFEDLRIRSAKAIDNMDFAGNAIGGLSIGEEKPLMYRLLEVSMPYLNPNKPRYLMGVGSPDCLANCVMRGADMFDCVLQTRMGRTGAAYERDGNRISLRNARYARDFHVIDPDCPCPACSGGFTKAYLRHLYMAQEILAATLVSAHNIVYTLRLMRGMREAIMDNRLSDYVNTHVCVT